MTLSTVFSRYPGPNPRSNHQRAATLVSLFAAVALSGCVKAQGPVLQGSGTGNIGAEQGSRSASAARPTPGGVATQNSASQVSGNLGAEPQAGSSVVEAIRKGPLEANGKVTHLVDGDTVDVAFSTGSGKPSTERIRLIGIDTPETKRPDTPVECFGREASSALAALIPIGTPVMVERDVEERDRYGRLLGYVFRASDGLFVNHEMVRAGMATPYTFPPNIAYVDVFAAAGDASRAAAVGLWSRCESGHTPAAG